MARQNQRVAAGVRFIIEASLFYAKFQSNFRYNYTRRLLTWIFLTASKKTVGNQPALTLPLSVGSFVADKFSVEFAKSEEKASLFN